jgi:hypothetical protein
MQDTLGFRSPQYKQNATRDWDDASACNLLSWLQNRQLQPMSLHFQLNGKYKDNPLTLSKKNINGVRLFTGSKQLLRLYGKHKRTGMGSAD